jgi:hypothetical protein
MFIPLLLYPRESVSSTHCIGGWVGPRASLDAMKKRKISFPCRESNRSFLVIQSVACPYTNEKSSGIYLEIDHIYITYQVMY